MAPLNRVIIDTDPGVDDILALLLALTARPDEIDVILISVCYGNIDIENCLRNVVSLFHIIHKEQEWRRSRGLADGFEALKSCKPIVAVGAEKPLADQLLMADYYHGFDGLGGIHSTHPHLTPEQTWRTLFTSATLSSNRVEAEAARELENSPNTLFSPSQRPAHEEILRLLRENEPDTISIVAIGPLTNLARAAALDPETFLRVKEVVVMGGTINTPGNVQQPFFHQDHHHPPISEPSAPPFRLIKAYPSPLRISLNIRNQITPVAEFNIFADSIAAARLFALTSRKPASTMPPTPPAPPGKVSGEAPPPYLGPYPENLSRTLKLTLFPLDITTPHEITRGYFRQRIAPLLSAGSPLAEWLSAFCNVTFDKVETLHPGVSGPSTSFALHDPLCIWYMLTRDSHRWLQAPGTPEDIRVETSGQWTRGTCVIDRRDRRRRPADDGEGGEIAGDTGAWLLEGVGNRINRIVGSPGENIFAPYMLDRILAQ